MASTKGFTNPTHYSVYYSLYLIITTFNLAAICESYPPQNLQELLNPVNSHYKIIEMWDERPPKDPNYLVKGIIYKDLYTDVKTEAYYLNDKLLSTQQTEALGIKSKNSTQIKELSIPSENYIYTRQKSKKDEVLIISKIQEFRSFQNAELISLPPLNKEKLIEEDDKSIVKWEKGIYKIGIVQELSQKITVNGNSASHGVWNQLPDGSLVWVVDIEFPESIGIRVNIEPLSTNSDNVQFWVIPLKNDNPSMGPFRPQEIHSLSNWLPTCFSDKVRIICEVKPEKSINDASFEIKEVIGIYQDPIQILSKAGSCNLDVTCYPEWANVSKGVVGLGVVDTPYALFCTGTLISDNDPCTQIPYILTANHCVSSQSGSRSADTVEFYWFYQTPTCNGAPPPLSTVPRTTGGADYLAGMGGNAYWGGGNDFTLLRMRNNPPQNATFVGWTTAILAIGTLVTDIHHPTGSYKRISFGRKTNNNNPYSFYYHEVTWDQGTTEPGSSGSPLMLTTTQQIIGQLWGGGASCDTPDEPDYFGRFDITYRFANEFLEPPAVQFTETSFNIEEQNYTKNITLSLSSPARTNGGEVSVRVETSNATSGVHFNISSQSITFAPNSTQANLSIQIFDNTHTEPDKKIKLILENPQCLRLADNNLSFELTIVDNDTDSDNDGLSDYDELNGVYGYSSNPNKKDSDNDGLSDYDEVMATHGYQTDPLNRDTDGDGVSDWVEIQYGSDPTDSLDFIPLNSIKIPWFSHSNLNR